MADDVIHMCSSQRTDPETLDIPSTSLVVIDTHDAHFNAEKYLDLSYISQPGEISIRSSLLVDFIVIGNECNKQSVQVPKTEACVFNLARSGFNTIGEH